MSTPVQLTLSPYEARELRTALKDDTFRLLPRGPASILTRIAESLPEADPEPGDTIQVLRQGDSRWTPRISNHADVTGYARMVYKVTDENVYTVDLDDGDPGMYSRELYQFRPSSAEGTGRTWLADNIEILELLPFALPAVED